MVAVTAGRAAGERGRVRGGARRAVVRSPWTDERFVADVDAGGNVLGLSDPLAEGDDGWSGARVRPLTDLGERLFFWSAGRYEFLQSVPPHPARRPRRRAHRAHPRACPSTACPAR